ncbi:MAG: hypothetical protein R3B67_03205 [Phycisphaerales bacterium]
MTMNQKRESEHELKKSVNDGVLDLKKDAQNIKDDLDVLKEDATQLGAHATQHTIEAAKAGVQGASDIARGACDSMKGYQEGMNERIRAHPTSSVLLALGAGVVLGRVIGALRS